jgi:hypothetical protein
VEVGGVELTNLGVISNSAASRETFASRSATSGEMDVVVVVSRASTSPRRTSMVEVEAVVVFFDGGGGAEIAALVSKVSLFFLQDSIIIDGVVGEVCEADGRRCARLCLVMAVVRGKGAHAHQRPDLPSASNPSSHPHQPIWPRLCSQPWQSAMRILLYWNDRS